MRIVKRLLQLARESLDLLRTYRPGLEGMRSAKVFGVPGAPGGPMTKHSQLSSVCAAPGEPYSTLICLSAVRVPLFLLKILKGKGARVIVNQNGVYYPLWAVDFAKRNRYLANLNALADHTFFQSQFAVDSYHRWVGPLPPSYSLLHNGVDLQRFSPDFSRATDSQKLRVGVFVDFRESTRELWSFMASLVKQLSGVKWIFLGLEESQGLVEELRGKVAGGDVEWKLSPTREEVPLVLRSCDAMLHFVYNDVCPNKVLEALASGVFVICSSAGGAKELVGSEGGAVLEVPEGFEKVHYPEVAAVTASIEAFRRNPEAGRRGAARAASRFELSKWLQRLGLA